MNAVNIRHHRYIKTSTYGIKILRMIDETFNDHPWPILQKIVSGYDNEVMNTSVNYETLREFYIVLCYEYQLKCQLIFPQPSDNFKYEFPIENVLKYIAMLKKEIVDEKRPIIFDIIILHLVLHANFEQIMNLFEHLATISGTSNYDDDDGDNDMLDIVDCYTEAFYLKTHFLRMIDPEATDVQKICQLNFIQLETNLLRTEKPKWKFFISILNKMILTFDESLTITNLWRMIFQKNYDYEKRLTLLSSMIDDILSVSNQKTVTLNNKYCSRNEIWIFIFDRLTSNIELHRKQATYVMKKIWKFVKPQKELSSEKNIIPFLYCKYDAREKLSKNIMDKFFLILESLEEKQVHLITPALEHVEELIQVNNDHQKCGNCFDYIWLHCVFRKILQHTTYAVVKLGVMKLLHMNFNSYDDELVLMLVQSLNNTKLYENKSAKQSLPNVMKQLAESFIKAERSQLSFMNWFIRTIPLVTWAPVPFFYIFEAFNYVVLHLENINFNIWTEKELEAVMEVLEKHFSPQEKIAKEVILKNIITIFSRCAKLPLDLGILAKYFLIISLRTEPNSQSISWESHVSYLKNNIENDVAEKFICRECDSLCINNNDSQINTKRLTIILALLYDSNKISLSVSSAVRKSLINVFDTIRNVNVRSYIDKTLRFQAMRFFTDFLWVLNRVNLDSHNIIIEEFIISYLHLMKEYLFKCLNKSASPETYEEVLLYVECFKHICALQLRKHPESSLPMFPTILNSEIFQDEAIKVATSGGNIVNLHGWYNLQIFFEAINIGEAKYDMNVFIYAYERIFREQIFNNKLHTNDSRQVIIQFYKVTAALLKLIKKYEWGKILNVESYWFACLRTLESMVDFGKEYIIATLAESLQAVVSWFSQLQLESISILKSIMNNSWKIVWNLKKNEYFWSSIISMLKLMLKTYNLKINSLMPLVTEHISYIITQSKDNPRLRNILMDECRRYGYLLNIQEELIEWFLHRDIGGIDKKIQHQKFLYAVHVWISNGQRTRYLDSYEEKICSLLTTSSEIYNDVFYQVNFLTDVIPRITNDKIQIIDVIKMCTSILVNLCNKRYFCDSKIHHLKHRIMQLLLLIEKSLEESQRRVLYDTISDLLVSESNQPTVRVMQEWLLMRIIILNFSFHDKIWNLLELAKKKRSGSITSVASIIYHVSKKKSENTYTLIAIRNLLSCCLGQKFVIRLYCQVIISKLFDLIDPEILPLEYAIIRDAISESFQHGNLHKNSVKLFQDFYFTTFDPIEDYNLPTIFYDLPRLLNMSIDELLPHYFMPNHFYKNYRDLLSKIDPLNLNDTNNTIILEREECIGDNISSNIQKKAIPWKSLLPEDQISIFRRNQLENDVGLIVVASLIDKVANLGGLSRTLEIFCGRELILANLKCVQQRDFQSLSVSSEKWVTLTEVKPHELKNYLLNKKSMGWTLVGAEQTANSTSLLDMKFDEKTVLLLGNEKSGIPADLIPVMDICVEIPQAGVVRSLNVHVTGAICLWDYARQHVFKN